MTKQVKPYKKIVIFSVVFVAVLLTISFAAGNRQNEKQSEQTSSSVAPTEIKKAPRLPVSVTADTDDERPYGSDILYCHDGLTVQYLDFNGSYLHLKFINDTDKAMTMETGDVTVNKILSYHFTLAIVDPHSEEERYVTDLNSELAYGESVDEITMNFLFTEWDEEDYSPDAESEFVSLKFSKKEPQLSIPEGAELYWECEDCRVYYLGKQFVQPEAEDNEDYAWTPYHEIYFFAENLTDKELIIDTEDDPIIIENDGEYEYAYVGMIERIPARSAAYTEMTVQSYSDSFDWDKVDEVTFKFSRYFADEDDCDELKSDEYTIKLEKDS